MTGRAARSALLWMVLLSLGACDRGVDTRPPQASPANAAVGAPSGEICRGPTAPQEGACAPDFSLPDLAGKIIRLQDLRGRVVMLNFWATWCPACLEEFSSLDTLARRLSERGLVLLAVNVEEDFTPPRAGDFFGSRPLAFHLLLDRQKSVAPRYQAFRLPETFIISKSGRIADRVAGPRDWADPLLLHYLERLLAE